jgi:hypothetical protein
MYILFSREVQVSGPKSLEVTKRSIHVGGMTPGRVKRLERYQVYG